MAEEKKKRLAHINIGTVIFLAVVIYLTAVVIRDLGREKLAVYEVGESIIDDEIKSSGVIIRKETLEKTDQEGYINYYLKDGAKVRNGGVIYTIDTSGKITSYLKDLGSKKDQISSSEKKQVFDDLRALQEGYSDDHFSDIYNARDTINYDLMAYSDTIIADNKEELDEKFGKNSYTEVTAPKAGLISYFSDGQEKLTVAKTDLSVINQKARMEDLRSRDKMKAGTPVYRLVSSQSWKLMLPVSKDEYTRLRDLKKKKVKTVEVTFLKDNFTIRADYEGKKKDDGYYIILNFDDYVQRYMNQRYLSVRILLNETKGLKIPTSSIVEKEVYKIPVRFLTNGSDSESADQVNIMTVSKKGEKVLHQKKVTVYKTDEEFAYISKDGLKHGDIIASLDKTDRFELVEKTSLQGVFMVNRGYAVFKSVTIVSRNEDYCIISPEESSIYLYDRIILNSQTIRENSVIY